MNQTDLHHFYSDKTVFITGAAGTVGKEISQQLLAFEPREIRLMDNNESELFYLMEARQDARISCYLGDVRDYEKVNKLASGADIIFHTAAFKHVILSEFNPFDVVQTNILGVENVINAAKACGVQRVIFTSSDKAVNPTNVMGTSKLMGERLTTAANLVADGSGTIFSSTRFGNVLGSRGSVLPLFVSQIRKGGPVTVTDERMTRFVMTVAESARLVLQSAVIARGGEVFVTKMPVIRISDLAYVMIEMLSPRYGFNPAEVGVEIIGAKPGEKIYEELMSEEEVERSLELDRMYVITPAFKSVYREISYIYEDQVADRCSGSYVSKRQIPMERERLKDYLIRNQIGDAMEELVSGEMA